MNKKPLLVIFLTVFLDLVGFGIIIPLSPFLARQFGASAFEVGVLMAVYSAMQFLFSPLWGRLSDRVGRRPVLLISIAGTALAHLLFYFAPSFFILILARLFAGVFSANISTAMAYIADVTGPQERSKSMGLIGAAFGLGFVLGPALGGWMAHYGEHVPALLAAVMSFANFGFAYFVLHETLAPENRKVRERTSRLKKIADSFARPVLGSLFFAQFAAVLAMANMEASMFLFVQDRFGWSMQVASFGFAYVGICIAFTQGFLVRKLLPKYGERKMLIVGFVFFSFGFFLIAISEWVWLLGIAMTFLALGNGLLNPALTGSVSLLSSATEQGEVIGVNQSLAALGRIFGPPLGGALYMSLSQTAPFFTAAVLGAIGFILIFRVYNKIPNAGRIGT